MIKIGNLTIDKFYLGDSSDVKIYLGEIKLYPNDEPQPVVSCYEVISAPMTSYTSTTYDSVYSWSDAKWYMKNNLSQYEEYGIYDIVENISSATTYNGKLAVVGTTEYEYSGGSWVVVGTYEDASTTYEITDEDPYEYEGVELSTTFKIPVSDVEALGHLNFTISTQDDGDLEISTYSYRYMGSASYNGTVTNDGEYYYFALPSEAPSSVIIQRIEYWDSTPIHLIVGSKQASVEYSAKTTPSSALTYLSVADMEAVSCPTVGVGQYCYTNGQAYKYSSNEEWVTAQDSEFFVKQVYDDGRVGVLGCGYSDTLNVGVLGNKSGSVLDVEPTLNVYIGGCVDTIGESALYGLKNMTACTISNGTKRIMSNAFISCMSLSSLTIPNTVEIIDSKYTFGNQTQNASPWWKSYSANTNNHYGNIVYINDVAVVATATTVSTFNFKENTKCIAGGCFTNCTNFPRINIPSTVKYIGNAAFYGCSNFSQLTLNEGLEIIEKQAFNQCKKLTSVAIPNSVTTLGEYAFAYDSGLTSVTIGSGLTSVGAYIFANCSGITNVSITEGLTKLGYAMFNNCKKLSSVVIPSTIEYIGGNAFSYCSGLTSVTCLAENPPELGDTAVFYKSTCPIYVPSQSVNAYKSATNWSTYSSRIQAIPEPTLQWVSYSEGDAIPNEGVYKIYGFKIPTQTLLDIYGNGNYLEIVLNSEEVDHEQHPVSFIDFALYSKGFFLTINGKSQEISYDPESDEYLEIIFSDYGADYNYSVGYFTYGEEGDTSQVYNFPFDMDLYEEDT